MHAPSVAQLLACGLATTAAFQLPNTAFSRRSAGVIAALAAPAAAAPAAQSSGAAPSAAKSSGAAPPLPKHPAPHHLPKRPEPHLPPRLLPFWSRTACC
ncbi:hypothetical protein PG997_007459 [Apiospora hydei]|uniref:Uncharacterized protein n=1 Tax=Apiospora hydei TaxID=1337664 RepID=A0ABR1WAU3_9PEZI